jgi:hypothetical protein
LTSQHVGRGPAAEASRRLAAVRYRCAAGLSGRLGENCREVKV